MSIVQRERHRNLASRVASASFVLLKNMNNTLPIQSQGNNKVILVRKTFLIFNGNIMVIFVNPDPRYTSSSIVTWEKMNR